MFHIKLQDVPGWPTTACRTCMKKLQDIIELKATIVSSQVKLRQLLSGTKIKVEPIKADSPNEVEDPNVGFEDPMKTDRVCEVWVKEEICSEDGEGDPETSLGDDHVSSIEDEDDNNSGDGEDSDPEYFPKSSRTVKTAKVSKEVDKNSYPQIVSVESLKEETLEDAVGDDLESSSEDENTTGSASDEDNGIGARAKKKKPPARKQTPEDPKWEEKLRDLKVLQCQPCDKTVSSFKDLVAHVKSVHNSKNVFISCCGLRFYGRTDSYDHMRYHLDEDAFKCPECGKRWPSGRKQKMHMESVHASGVFKCEECGKAFKTLKILRKHVESVHGGDKRYLCTTCGRTYRFKAGLQIHIERFHCGVRVKCPFCTCSYKYESNLIAHQRAAHPEEYGQLVRPEVQKVQVGSIAEGEEEGKGSCDGELGGPDDRPAHPSEDPTLKKPGENTNPRMVSGMSPQEGVWEDAKFEEMLQSLDIIRCRKCDLVFTSLTGLSKHNYRVHKTKNYSVTCCGVQFMFRPESYDHMRFHLNQDAFQCEECGKRCLSGAKLRAHRRETHSPKQFECTECGKKCKSLGALKSHRRSHIAPKGHPFKCPECGKGLSTKDILRDHLRRVHGNKMICDICGMTVRDMWQHKKIKHPTADQLKTCDVCKKAIPTVNFHDHIQKVHSGQRFPCETCGRKYKTKYNLTAHVKRDHPS